MALVELKIDATGVSPLLMHNGQLANPLNRFSKMLKEISGKRKKTDEDLRELSRIEWIGGLYTDQNERLVVPTSMIEGSLIEGAKKSKLGKAFKSAVFCQTPAELIINRKYQKASELWGDDSEFVDIQGVRVGQSRVMRTRPIFRNWSASFSIMFDDEQVNMRDVQRAATDAGTKCGIGDFRPKYGRFDVAFA